MKFTPLSAWAALALAGGIYAAPSIAATTSVIPVPPAVPAPPAVPSRLAAMGRTQPIGSQIQLSWLPAPRTQAYKVYRDGQFLALSSRAFWTDYGVAAGETHSYTVASLISARGSRPFIPASATVPAGGGSVVYADKLENGWQSWSWAATDFASTSPVRSGSAIRVAAGPWQALYLHHAPFNASAYTAVTFWVHGGSTGGQKLCVKALQSGVPQAAVFLDPLPAGKWQSVTISLRDLGVAGALDLDGLWVQDASGTTQPAFSVDEIALTAAPALAPPVAPAGLSATPQWEASCAECGGMAMAHIALAWNAVAGASSYTVYRYGAKVQGGLTAPTWTEMDATSGKTYAYTVSATGRGGEGPQSVSAAATAPNPPPGAALTAPVNLTVQGLWQGAPTDALVWSPVSGAASYNVYQYGIQIAKGVTATSYTVPTSVFCGSMTYAVTAADATGMETLPSAITTAQGGGQPRAGAGLGAGRSPRADGPCRRARMERRQSPHSPELAGLRLGLHLRGLSGRPEGCGRPVGLELLRPVSAARRDAHLRCHRPEPTLDGDRRELAQYPRHYHRADRRPRCYRRGHSGYGRQGGRRQHPNLLRRRARCSRLPRLRPRQAQHGEVQRRQP